MNTKQKLDTLYSLFDEITQIDISATEKLNAAREAGKDSSLKFVRDGKEIEVKEKHLWREATTLGTDSDAGKKLREKYPEVFEAYDLQNKKAEELREFTVKEFGIDYRQLRLSDVAKLVEMLVEYRMGNKGTFLSRIKWLFFGK